MPANNRETAVRLDRISRAFGATTAVKGVSLEIMRGEIVSLVGHSGCGKSTLLRIISGVETVDSGGVLIHGREVDGRAFVEPEERGIGFVFQDYALFPHLSVRDNILFGLKRQPRSAARAGAEDVIRRVGIEHLADRFPHTLSGGEQQRVALARALAPRPAIILMDEPFSNLDQGLRGRVRADTIALLRSFNATVIMVTHDPQEALSTGDRVVLMRGGEIIQAGSPYDLYDRPQSVYAAEFFCAANAVPGVCREKHIDTAIGSFPKPANLKSEEGVTLYIRPHAVRISLETGEVSARIEQRVFLGDAEQLSLRIDGLQAPLVAITSERLPASVEAVKISLAQEGVFAF